MELGRKAGSLVPCKYPRTMSIASLDIDERLMDTMQGTRCIEIISRFMDCQGNCSGCSRCGSRPSQPRYRLAEEKVWQGESHETGARVLGTGPRTHGDMTSVG